MEAAEALVRKVLEGTKQFVVPHFQRPYAWREEQWRVLWTDLIDRVESEDQIPHFIGPIVTAPARTIPEGVEKRLLIDGQQRLTTLVVLLTVIREEARRTKQDRLADMILDLVTNRHYDGLDRFKLLPTQGESIEESDRAALAALIEGTETSSKSRIIDAQRYFERRISAPDAPSPQKLFDALTRKLALVSIILGEADNPHRIFESLNGKGRPLTQGDLIRNFFFMRIDEKEHERVYSEVWRPMQKRLGEDRLTDFIRHDLAASTGTLIRETDVYTALKAKVDREGDPLTHLRRLAQYAGYYEVLLRPQLAEAPRVRALLERILRFDITVAYPLLLPAYAEHKQGRLAEHDLCRLLEIVETYMLRRFVCGVPTYGLNKTFAPLFTQHGPADDTFVQRVADAIAKKDCPRDGTFRERLQTAKLYGGGERREKLKLVLEKLEAMAGHKEAIDPSTLTIEHVMPQTLTPEWTAELGADADDTHDDFLHTLGNLTLTGYNSELGNLPFAAKRQKYAESHLELNTWFSGVERWTRVEIDRRAAALAEQALQAWPWFGPALAENDAIIEGSDAGDDVTGTVPRELIVRGKTYPVRSWADVAKAAAGLIIEQGSDTFERVAAELPKYLNADATAFRKSSKLARLENGAYLETNLSAIAIHRFVRRALGLAGIDATEWSVVHADPDDDDGSDDDQGESELALTRLELWTQVRKSLVASGAFSSLRPPKTGARYGISLGRSGIHMNLVVGFRDKRVNVRLVLAPRHVETVLPQLTAQRAEIEKELGFPLNWVPFPERKLRTITVWRSIDLDDRQNWPAAIDVLTSLAVKMHGAFAPRVISLAP